MPAIITETTNPFNPQQDVQRHIVEDCGSLLDWLDQRFGGFTEFSRPTICIVNGEPLLRQDWGYQLRDGDIVAFVALAPGASGLVILKVIYWIAVVAMAAYAVYMASNIPKPNSNTKEQDSIYSLTGQSNKLKLAEPIEVPYGRVRMWPSYAAASYNKFEDDDQILYSLFCLGQGEYDIEAIQVEDTDISNFDDVEYEVIPPGGSMSLFADNVVTSTEVSYIELFGPNEDDYEGWTGGFIVNGAGTQATRLEVDVVLPYGLYNTSSDGDLKNYTVTAEFEYRTVDDNGDATGEWATLVSFSKTMKTINAKRYTLGLDVPAGRYEVRAHRTNNASDSSKVGDTVQWAYARAILPSTVDYGDVTLLAVKAKASNNLNDNAAKQFNVIATRKLPVWSPETGWSAPIATRSIVWAFCDLFRADYGGNLADSYLDLDALYDLDQVYTGLDEHCDYVIDQKSTVWAAATTIALSLIHISEPTRPY